MGSVGPPAWELAAWLEPSSSCAPRPRNPRAAQQPRSNVRTSCICECALGPPALVRRDRQAPQSGLARARRSLSPRDHGQHRLRAGGRRFSNAAPGGVRLPGISQILPGHRPGRCRASRPDSRFAERFHKAAASLFPAAPRRQASPVHQGIGPLPGPRLSWLRAGPGTRVGPCCPGRFVGPAGDAPGRQG